MKVFIHNCFSKNTGITMIDTCHKLSLEASFLTNGRKLDSVIQKSFVKRLQQEVVPPKDFFADLNLCIVHEFPPKKSVDLFCTQLIVTSEVVCM